MAGLGAATAGNSGGVEISADGGFASAVVRWQIVSTFRSTASTGGGASVGGAGRRGQSSPTTPTTKHADHKTSVLTGNKPASCSVTCENGFNRSFKRATPSKLVSQPRIECPALPILRSGYAD